MKAMRWSGAIVLGLLAALLGLGGVLLCITVLLAPLGILVLWLARRLWRAAGALVVPRPVRHPLEALGEAGSSTVEDVGKSIRKRGKRVRRSARKASKRAKRTL